MPRRVARLFVITDVDHDELRRQSSNLCASRKGWSQAATCAAPTLVNHDERRLGLCFRGSEPVVERKPRDRVSETTPALLHWLRRYTFPALRG